MNSIDTANATLDTAKLRDICLAAMPDRAKSEADIFRFQSAFQIDVCLSLLDELEAVRRARDEACKLAEEFAHAGAILAHPMVLATNLARISTLRAVGVRP